MYSTNGQLFYSPSDLTCFMESPFASWMDRYVIEYPAQAPAADPPDDLLQALAKQGLAHEQAIEKKFVQQGLDFIAIQGQSSVEKRTATWQAMRAGIAVIAQARLEIDEFGGYSDFLVRVPGSSSLGNYHYEVWDAKLAARAKPSFLIQLCGYAHMLEAVQGRRPDSLTFYSFEHVRIAAELD